MFYLLLACTLLVAGFILLSSKNDKKSKETKRIRDKRILRWLIIGVTILLLLRFGLPHFAAIFGALIVALPYVLRAMQTFAFFNQLCRIIPFWKQKSNSNQPSNNATSTNMTLEEAEEILGLESNNNPTLDEIEKAYRQKMKMYHPDIGGSKTFTILLQQAKETLIHHHKKNKTD